MYACLNASVDVITSILASCVITSILASCTISSSITTISNELNNKMELDERRKDVNRVLKRYKEKSDNSFKRKDSVKIDSKEKKKLIIDSKEKKKVIIVLKEKKKEKIQS